LVFVMVSDFDGIWLLLGQLVIWYESVGAVTAAGVGAWIALVGCIALCLKREEVLVAVYRVMSQ
jgi:hypothetical protein